MRVPETRYARSGDLRIAYQTWGSGPPVLIIADLISNVEITWEHELYRRSFEHLGKHMTCAYFDKRGIGMSDRFEEIPTLEQRNDDILAVLDEMGWETVHILGQSEGAAMGSLFAADHPARVESLTLVNTFVPPRYAGRVRENIQPGDPRILNPREIYQHFERVMETWGEDATFLVEWATPSQVGNEAFIRWVARLQRMAASPKAFRQQLDSIFGLDAGDAPERISARTMVMHVKGDKELHVSMGRLLAQIIPNATFVEIEGEDHLFWVMPNWRDVADTFIEFATGAQVERTTERSFATVLFTDIVNSTERSASVGDDGWRDVLDRHDREARQLIDEHGGRVVKSTGDGLLVLFDTPSLGVACGLRMCETLQSAGIEIRAGLHAGEVEVHDDGDISGIAVNLAARVEQTASDGELWASSTVRDMMLGGSTVFSERGEYELKGIDGVWRLFSVASA